MSWVLAWPVTEGVFVADELMLDLSFPAARARLGALARGGLLMSASDDAYGAEITGLMRVGPPGFSRLVRIQFRDLPGLIDSAGLALRWEVAGPGGALFPVLDADITLVQAGPQASRLTIAGAYRPPLGALGDALDRAVLHRVATATVRDFLRRIAAATCMPDRSRVKSRLPAARLLLRTSDRLEEGRPTADPWPIGQPETRHSSKMRSLAPDHVKGSGHLAALPLVGERAEHAWLGVIGHRVEQGDRAEAAVPAMYAASIAVSAPPRAQVDDVDLRRAGDLSGRARGPSRSDLLIHGGLASIGKARWRRLHLARRCGPRFTPSKTRGVDLAQRRTDCRTRPDQRITRSAATAAASTPIPVPRRLAAAASASLRRHRGRTASGSGYSCMLKSDSDRLGCCPRCGRRRGRKSLRTYVAG